MRAELNKILNARVLNPRISRSQLVGIHSGDSVLHTVKSITGNQRWN